MERCAEVSRPGIDKVVFLSDVHLGVRNASIEWSDNVSGYFEGFFLPLIERMRASGDRFAVVVAGDFFDNRQQLNISILNIGADIVGRMSSVAEVFMLVGNHDIYKRQDTHCSSLRAFAAYPGVSIVDDLTMLRIAGGRGILLVPWVGDAARETAIVSDYSSLADIMVMHSDISGLTYDNGMEVMDGVNVSTFAGRKIYSGHIHKRQTSADGKVTYLGSPYQLRRSDIGNDKGIYTVAVADTPEGPAFKEEFIRNDYSPKFYRFGLRGLLEMTTAEIRKAFRNNYCDVVVRKDEIDRLDTGKLIAVLDDCLPRKVEIILDKTQQDAAEAAEAPSGDLTFEDAFSNAVGAMNLSDEEADKIKELNRYYMAKASDELNIVEQ